MKKKLYKKINKVFVKVFKKAIVDHTVLVKMPLFKKNMYSQP